MSNTDKIVYSVNCTWWDSISKIAVRDGLPRCPHCGSVLFEEQDEATWFASVDRHEARWHPGYRQFIEWARGKCFPNYGAALAAFDRAAQPCTRILEMSKSDRAEEKLAQAYQVIGNLLRQCGLFESDEGQRALDYFSDISAFDADFLPWPRGGNADDDSAACQSEDGNEMCTGCTCWKRTMALSS